MVFGVGERHDINMRGGCIAAPGAPAPIPSLGKEPVCGIGLRAMNYVTAAAKLRKLRELVAITHQ